MEHRRFVTPRQGEQFPSEYDFPSDLLTDLQGRDVAPLVIYTLDLSSAGSKDIHVPGRGFVPYFYQTASAIKTRQTAGLITTYVNQRDASNPAFAHPSKYNRGFRGSFSRLYLTWAAQAGTSVDFLIHRSDLTPWMTDDIDFNTVGTWGGPASVLAISASGSVGPQYSLVVVDDSVAPVTVTLPNANAFIQAMGVKRNPTVATGMGITVKLGAGNIENAATYVLPGFVGSGITVISDGSNGFIGA